MTVSDAQFTAVPYLIQPRSEDEALHGKPVLLTDTELAVLIAALPRIPLGAADIEAIKTNLWHKFLAVWCVNECDEGED